MDSDDLLEKAHARLRALIEERRELEIFIATYRRLSRESQGVQETAPEPARPASSDEVVLATMQLIAAKDAPMRLGEIYEELIKQGIVIGGKIPRNNLGAKLSADSRLRTVSGLGWWFASEPLPAPVKRTGEPDPYQLPPYEEGPDTDVSEPLQLNGAAVGAA